MHTYDATEQQVAMLDFLGSTTDQYYLILEAFEVSGPLDVPRFCEAVKELVGRHDSLRSVVGRGRDTMTVGSLAEWRDRAIVTVEDCSGSELTEVAARAEAHCCRPMDLTTEWPLRAWVGKLSPTSHVVTLAGHHLTLDGWSFKNLFSELAAAYAGQPLPEPSQYADAALAAPPEACEFAGPLFGRKYRAIRALSAMSASTRLGPAEQSVVHLGTDVAEALGSAAGALNTTPYTLAVSGLIAALRQELDDTEAIVGTASTGRTKGNAVRAIGYFSNTIFMGSSADAMPDILTDVNRLHRQWMTTPRIQWESLLAAHGAEDLYAIKFGFGRAEMTRPGLRLPGLEISRLEESSSLGVARRCLDITGRYDASGIVMSATHRTDAFAAATIERILNGTIEHALAISQSGSTIR